MTKDLLNAEINQEREDSVNSFDYEQTKEVSDKKTNLIVKSAQKMFRSKHGHNFQGEDGKQEDYDSHIVEARKKFNYIT